MFRRALGAMKYRSLNKLLGRATQNDGEGFVAGQNLRAHLNASFSSRNVRAFDCIELLETRIAPAVITAMWIGGDGNWDDPSHWDIGAVPNNGGGNTYHAVINVPGDAQISINGSFTLDSIVNHEALFLRSGSMFNLAGSNSINEGLIQLQYSPGSTRLTLGGTFTNDGTIRTEQTHGYGHLIGEIYLNADTLIDGSGVIEMAAGSTPVINGAADTELTLGADQTLHGQGNINVPVINHGTLQADVSGWWLYTTAGVNNDGVLGAKSGGILSLGGVACTTTKDIVAESGGVVRLLDTALELNGKTLLADGGEVRLDHSAVAHGNVQVSDNTSSAVTLYNAVTFTLAPWVDGGAGYFLVPHSSAAVLGDRHIPAGVNLVISHSSSLDLSSPLRKDASRELSGGTPNADVILASGSKSTTSNLRR